MVDYKWSDNHFGLAGLNIGMMAYSLWEGNPDMAAFNGGLLVLNSGLAVNGRREEFREMGRGLKKTPGKALGTAYDLALSDDVAEDVLEASSDLEKKGGRRRHGAGQRIR